MIRTAECVSPMHPDKMCDRISDTLLDLHLRHDPYSRVAIETAGGNGLVYVTGEVTLPEGTEMVMPGDNTNLSVKLIAPIAMEKGLKFAIREGGRTVGAGQVTEIIK